MSRCKVVGKQDKTGKRVHAGIASCSRARPGQITRYRDVRGVASCIYHSEIPKSAQCKTRERGREREKERKKRERERGVRSGSWPSRGARRDVVQVDLWKVGGKRERETLCVCVAGQPRFTVTGTNRWTNLT